MFLFDQLFCDKVKLDSLFDHECQIFELLEQRQYKNDSIQSKIIPILKLARFFTQCLGGEKERYF